MCHHALEATGGKMYAEMDSLPRRLRRGPPRATRRPLTKSKNGKPVDNPARNLWVTETALSTALDTAYFAERVATFSIVMGIALLLTGFGFLILTLRVLREPAAGTAPAGKAAARGEAVTA